MIDLMDLDFEQLPLNDDLLVEVLTYVARQPGVFYRTTSLPNGTIRHYITYDQTREGLAGDALPAEDTEHLGD